MRSNPCRPEKKVIKDRAGIENIIILKLPVLKIRELRGGGRGDGCGCGGGGGSDG
jgi:hypothetical protein